MSTYGVEMQDKDGNIIYPHSSASLIKYEDNDVETKITQMESDINYLSTKVRNETANLKDRTNIKTIEFPYNEGFIDISRDWCSDLKKQGNIVIARIECKKENGEKFLANTNNYIATLPDGWCGQIINITGNCRIILNHNTINIYPLVDLSKAEGFLVYFAD